MAFACTIPAQPTVQRDDADMRITRWDFPPGAVTGQHTHGLPYFVVMLTGFTMRVDAGSGVTETLMAAGDSYGRPAGIEHDVMNAGNTAAAFIEIEVKRAAGAGIHRRKRHGSVADAVRLALPCGEGGAALLGEQPHRRDAARGERKRYFAVEKLVIEADGGRVGAIVGEADALQPRPVDRREAHRAGARNW